MKDHVEGSLNHFRHGKSHTSPGKEADIVRLQASYNTSKVHTKVPGRKVDLKHKLKDYVGLGLDTFQLTCAIARWLDNRVSECSDKEIWPKGE